MATATKEQAPYDSAFFARNASTSRDSAEAVVPLLLAEMKINSAVDVGCGSASWAGTFLRHGVADVIGVDGDYVDRSLLEIPVERFIAKDLDKPFDLGRTFDLAFSVEVAEHLTPSRAPGFVADLVKLAPIVLFSAALPGQGGLDHRNERWLSYWVDLFGKHNYRPLDCIRYQIWNDEKVMFWYRQNIMVFCRADLYPKYAHLDHKAPVDAVHPELLRRKTHSIEKPTIGFLLGSLPGAVKRSINYRLKGQSDV
jgi:SAM-dependent methyltransferase